MKLRRRAKHAIAGTLHACVYLIACSVDLVVIQSEAGHHCLGAMSMSLEPELPPPPPPLPPPGTALQVSQGSGKQSGALKDIADRHPLFVAIGIFLVGTAVGALPLAWLSSKADADLAREQVKVEALETRLSSVTRTVGDVETSVIPLDEIIIDEGEARTLPTTLEYHRDDDFYVSAPEQWSYHELTVADLLSMQGEPDDASNSLGDLRLHVWRARDENAVSYDDRSVSAFSFVAVARISTDALVQALIEPARNDEPAGDDEELLSRIEALLREDPLGGFFQFMATSALLSETSNPVTLVGDIQRTDLGLYARFTELYTNVSVDGVQVDRFYLEQEWILLATDDGIAVIVTNLPSLDRRSDSVDESAKIIETLRIVD